MWGNSLIVTPHAILGQWEQELHKHTKPGTLKVLVYDGVRRTQRKLDLYCIRCTWPNLTLFSPYATLRAEVHHIHEVRRSSKFKKRFRPIPSPLVALRWWRLALVGSNGRILQCESCTHGCQHCCSEPMGCDRDSFLARLWT